MSGVRDVCCAVDGDQLEAEQLQHGHLHAGRVCGAQVGPAVNYSEPASYTSGEGIQDVTQGRQEEALAVEEEGELGQIA